MSGYSPKLRAAMAEIKAVIEKHDIAACVFLHFPGYSEYLLNLSPSYSCIVLNNEGIRFRATEAQYGVGGRRQMMEDTSNMVIHFAQVLAENAVPLIELEKILRSSLDISDV